MSESALGVENKRSKVSPGYDSLDAILKPLDVIGKRIQLMGCRQRGRTHRILGTAPYCGVPSWVPDPHPISRYHTLKNTR